MCRRSRGASGAAYARPQLVRLTSLSYPLPNRCRPIYRGGRSRLVAQGGLKDPPWRWRPSSGIRFDSQVVIHCDPELLLASKVALRRLDGDVAK
jgi:hypothetical protein